ncbi:hypothetical protein BgiBS90_024911, partial [Biomphalaria glabrata]
SCLKPNLTRRKMKVNRTWILLADMFRNYDSFGHLTAQDMQVLNVTKLLKVLV